MRPPWRFETKRRSASQKKTNQLLLTSTRDWWYISYPRPTFDLVMAGQRSIIGEIDVFSSLQEFSNGAMADIAMNPLPSCLVDNWHYFDI